ncbi:hypothetical protein ASPWEDRAFT_42928 [Aspergillus wentii DTO 134E9]|uniref:Aminoglycoside phosphotransferase domain-containing protein n=1 Tax=Aspergillus wentii DTO 134E9 TaxID=1073089 RepID=A0A1L9RD81_ASPWE|nr:uncharacterized protein ASPWEDRAFT_42928 [Aspergillus wentii DTO 134E9]OJJ32890.1 hypothetical protein ASPWEDRAFT_42928 [Aspergillus wentii DTO 134E9]
MGDAAPTLPNNSAAQWNRDLMLEFQAALQRNPAADLMSMFPDSYIQDHRNAQYRQVSYAASINLRVLDDLYDTLKDEPEVNLLSAFPKNYTRRLTMATGPKVVPKQEPETTGPPEFRTRLDYAETAAVVYPLSDVVKALLASKGWLNNTSESADKSLISSLKKLLWDSTKLWESTVRGVVVQCNEDIVAKVITGNGDYTEYTSMQYLKREVPDIPAPRPRGLIAFGPFRVIFMTYIPGTTLAQAWPSLLHEDKLSIQRQLNDTFYRLRTLQQDDGKVLGGVHGEGVKAPHVDECALFKGITTTKEYTDLQFSARHHGSTTYISLLCAFLEHDKSTLMNKSVFTHGDVRPDNIMVKQDPSSSGQYVVTGIIDWEDSGFYPFYYECTTLTYTMNLVNEDDWYLYLPESISPLEFPVRWLVDRLWLIHLRTT